MTTTIYFPEMGEGVIEGTLTRWLVKEGQVIQAYDPIAELETDKVTTEINSEVAGTVLKLHIEEGQMVAVETALATIGGQEEMVPVPENGEGSAVPSNGHHQPEPYRGRISPVVGRIAAEHAVDLAMVAATGRDGRVTKQDILTYIEQREMMPEPVEVETVAPLETADVETAVIEEKKKPEVVLADGDELLPLTGMRRAIAEHMVMSKRTSPHVTTVFEFDFSAAAAHRAAHKESFAQDGAKLTYTVYIASAIVQALKKHPLVNSVWSNEGIILKREINIGMAAAVEGGLLVPVIRQADGMNLLGLARAINELTERARRKELSPQELQGGTFSFTNHGTSGSLLATPIINQPQVGILGIGKIEKRVKVIDDAIAIRPLAYASFTFDHRVLDGKTADDFVGTVKGHIEG